MTTPTPTLSTNVRKHQTQSNQHTQSIKKGLVEVVDESSRPATARERAAADPTRAPPALGRRNALSRASVLATAAYGEGGVRAAADAADAAVAAAGGKGGGGEGGGEDDDEEAPEREVLGPGDCLAEVSYFTEVPKADSVRCLTVCRVLVLPRSAYTAIAANFPISARQVRGERSMGGW